MNGVFIELLFGRLTGKWGSSKLIKVLSLATFGASSFAFIGASFISDDPDVDNEDKNYQKKENN